MENNTHLMVFIQLFIAGILIAIWAAELPLISTQALSIYHQIPPDILKRLFMTLQYALPITALFITLEKKEGMDMILLSVLVGVVFYMTCVLYIPIALPIGVIIILVIPILPHESKVNINLPSFPYREKSTILVLTFGAVLVAMELFYLYLGSTFFDTSAAIISKCIILLAFALQWESTWKKSGGSIFTGILLVLIGLAVLTFFYGLTVTVYTNQFKVMLIIYFLGWCSSLLGIALIFNEHDSKKEVKFKKHPRNRKKMALSLKYTAGGWLNIVDWSNHVLLVGASGFGKTTILKQIVRFFIKRGRCGIIVDYKEHDIAEVAYHTYLKKYGENNSYYRFNYLSFHDPKNSKGCNPLLQIDSMAKARLSSMALHQNLARQEDVGNAYFADSAEGLLAGCTFFLKSEYPQFCTIPHLIRLVCHFELDAVLPLMAENIDIQPVMTDIRSCLKNGAGEQASGTLGKLRSFLSKIDDKVIMYLFTKNDFSLDLNNNKEGGVLAIGCSEDMQTVYAPLISTVVSISANTMRNRGKREWFLLFEELSKYIIPDLRHLITTIREGGGSILAALQNTHTYGLELGKVAEEIFQGFYNLLVMNTKGNTAKMMSGCFGEMEKEEKSETKSKGSKSSSTVRKVMKPRVAPSEFSDLRKGEVIASTQTPAGQRLLSRGLLREVKHRSKTLGASHSIASTGFDTSFERILTKVQLQIVNDVNSIIEDAKVYNAQQQNEQDLKVNNSKKVAS